MSHLFYDHIITLETIEDAINQIASDHQQKQELWQLVDGITHQRVLHIILTHLPEKHHHQLLILIKDSPYSEDIFTFLEDKTQINLEKQLEQEKETLTQELLELITAD